MPRLSLRHVAAAAYATFVLVLAVATFVEWRRGTEFVTDMVYGSWWFAAIMAAVVVPGMAVAAKALTGNWRAAMLHASLAIIATGALVSKMFGTEGILHLREGREATAFETDNGLRALPADFRLDSFIVKTYPHTDAPMDYVSHLTVNGERRTVSMNNVLNIRGYRLFQSSYDTDGLGTTLTVNHDPWGMGVTYLGYASLLVSLLLVLTNPRGRFRRLMRGAAAAICSLGFIPLATSCAEAYDTPVAATLPAAKQVERFERLNVIYQGRNAPVGAYCSDFMLKVTGGARWRGLDAETVVLGWMLHPTEWQDEPMIKVKDEAAARSMGVRVEGGHTAAAWLFDPDSHYRLTPYLRRGDKAAIDINDRLQAIIALTDGSAFRPSGIGIAPWRRNLELAYCHTRPTALLFKIVLALGVIMLGAVIWSRGATSGRQRRFMMVAMALCVALQFAALVARGLIAGCWPLTNGYETMLVLALGIGLAGMPLCRRQPLLASACAVMSGLALLVASIGMSNPNITPLMPVLHSPWLSIHVACVMTSYSLFSVIMLNSVIALARGGEGQAAALRVSLLLLYLGVATLAAGIFIGAVWANESWGRYWSWDPKEVWALITLLVYAVPLHPTMVPAISRPHVAHAYLAAAFLCVLMTYFGVNCLLGGMHSYA